MFYKIQFVTTVLVEGSQSDAGEQAANVAKEKIKAVACEEISQQLRIADMAVVQVEVSKSINYRNFYDNALLSKDYLKAEYSESEHKIVCDTCRWHAHEDMNNESDHNYGERNASCCVFCDTKVFDSSDTIEQVLDEKGQVPELYGGSMDGRA